MLIAASLPVLDFLFPLLLNAFGYENQFNSVLAYVISGNWDRGFNIFSIAQCVLLIAGMLIFNMVFDIKFSSQC